jgi:cytochrome d ubiquinol oxidase subunit II
MDLNTIWFMLLTVLLVGYAVLDGFDLGVGILHLFARKDEERRIFMNAIGPLWDGNEVWLITFGGALFAAFPTAYATVFPTFYTPFMMLLCALIFRAASMEFRSKRPSALWRSIWDTAFCLSSAVAALLFGVATGNAIRGLAIDGAGVYQGSFFDFLNPFSLCVGLMSVAMFAMHGALFLRLKTGGELNARLRQWSFRAAALFTAIYIIVTVLALATIPHARPVFNLWFLAPLNVLAIFAVFSAINRDKPLHAFLFSSGIIALLCLMLAAVLYPNLVLSSLSPDFHLDIYRAASSTKTLIIMLAIVLMALPLVLIYTVWMYRIFHGEVKIDKYSY